MVMLLHSPWVVKAAVALCVLGGVGAGFVSCERAKGDEYAVEFVQLLIEHNELTDKQIAHSNGMFEAATAAEADAHFTAFKETASELLRVANAVAELKPTAKYDELHGVMVERTVQHAKYSADMVVAIENDDIEAFNRAGKDWYRACSRTLGLLNGALERCGLVKFDDSMIGSKLRGA